MKIRTNDAMDMLTAYAYHPVTKAPYCFVIRRDSLVNLEENCFGSWALSFNGLQGERNCFLLHAPEAKEILLQLFGSSLRFEKETE
jgi:hypothetical protein